MAADLSVVKEGQPMMKWHHQHDSMPACAALQIGPNVIFHVMDFPILLFAYL